MTDQQERVARVMGFAGRARNDVSEDALEWWLYTGEVERQRLIKMARSAIAAMPAPTVQEWQPIKTAPKDGTKFLGYWPSTSDWEGEDNSCIVKTWFSKHGWENPFEAAYPVDGPDCPTHWMPEPAPPLAEQEGE
jgi:hypothetical protein